MKRIFLLWFLIQITSGARILAVIGNPSFSHQLFYRPIWLELAKRGHDIVLLTTDPMPEVPANIKQIDWHFAYEIRHNKYDLAKRMKDCNFNIFTIMNSFQEVFHDIVDEELSSPEVQVLIRNETEYFDLVITEYLPATLTAFSERFKCSFVTVFSTEVGNSYHQVLGNMLNPVLYPEHMASYEINLNFEQRLSSTLYWLYNSFYKQSSWDKMNDALLKKHFGQLPPLRDIVRNVSVVLVNSHHVFSSKPMGPGFIRIGGGLHVSQKNELPQDIKSFLDSAAEGVIYFSLGTNVRSSNIQQDILNKFLNVFKRLPYKILWKLDADIPDIPANIKIFKWVPQQDVLRHKNIKLFITQCGAQSMEESILAEVPLLVIPFISDQKMNAQKIVNRGLGIEIDRTTMTDQLLYESIMELINNESYKRRVKKTAILLKDEPMSGLEKAIWWIEYVIRHKGAKHLWHPNLDLPLYKYFLLDVFAFLLLVIVVLSFMIYMVCYFLRKKFFSSCKVVKVKKC
ncbi:UDP-glucosyltransferase 2 [Diabrotica virgifera virgifera]|uniref:UDP-glucuronosyltransferase n=1 Tax=Diabrotica virgifera virgifera TaxID=50390 RepID=A0A6P7FCU5_DIAVI|nr:UDP-glucosyltransferase 2 [Diabrotica virgifera virgifera]